MIGSGHGRGEREDGKRSKSKRGGGGFIPRPCSPSARIVNPLLCNTLPLAQGNRNISTRCATVKV